MTKRCVQSAWWVGLILVIACIAPGCDTSSGTDVTEPPAVDLTGDWNFISDESDPPHATECSGDLTVDEATVCESYSVTFEQSGSELVGTGASDPCGTSLTTTGVVAGSALTGVFVFEDNRDSNGHRWTYSGTVVDNTPVVRPLSFSVDGIEGSCAFAGAYIGLPDYGK